MTRLPGRILFVALAVAVFLGDRVTKLLVHDRLAVGERRELIAGVLELRHVQNRGIAFGLFSGAGALVVVGSIFVGILLFVFMLRVEANDYGTIAGGALITGGAVGNLLDRVQHGYVTDFLNLPRWPTFNVADIGIVLGVVLVMAMQLVQARREARGEPALGRRAHGSADAGEPARDDEVTP